MLSKKVYITPSAFVAFVDRGHTKHPHASAYFRYFGIEKYWLFTDSQSITEAYRRIYTDISPSLAKDFMRTIYLSDINILYPQDSDMKASLKAIVTYRSTDFTFSEALIDVLAYRRGIQQICTFDYFHQLFGLENFYLPI